MFFWTICSSFSKRLKEIDALETYWNLSKNCKWTATFFNLEWKKIVKTETRFLHRIPNWVVSFFQKNTGIEENGKIKGFYAALRFKPEYQ